MTPAEFQIGHTMGVVMFVIFVLCFFILAVILDHEKREK